MSAKAINEATGKNLLNNCLSGAAHVNCRFASVDHATNYDKLAQQNPWLLTEVSERDIFIVRRCHNVSRVECGFEFRILQVGRLFIALFTKPPAEPFRLCLVQFLWNRKVSIGCQWEPPAGTTS